jgi:hypothetical protein
MLIYNITTLVEGSVRDAWLTWLTDVHIPEIMSSDCFLRYQVLRVLDADESQGYTYALQFFAEDREACERFSSQFAPGLEKANNRLWGEKCVSFRTLMEVVK